MNNPMIYITTPPMKCLFGIQKTGNQFQMSLQFTDYDEDNIMKSFYEWIQEFEFSCMKLLGLGVEDGDLYISQIKYDKNGKYDPNLSVKLPFSYNRFDTDIYTENSNTMNLLSIPNFTMVQCDIYMDKLWKMNEKFYSKWKCKVIHIL